MLLLFKYFKFILKLMCFLTISVTSESISYDFGSKYDLPIQSVIEEYVRVLQNITNFYLENTNKVSISISFGIFIGNVHLGRAIKDFKITSTLKADIIDVYMKSEDVIRYYQWNIANGESGTECLKISKLFSNVSEWIDRVEEFKLPEDKYSISRELEKVYRNWKQYAYVANVRRAYQWIPSPVQSDNCLKSLAAGYRDTVDYPTCFIDDQCYRILLNGSDIGYALCHRALILLMARNSRACSIFSPREDRELLDNFCSMAYAEAEYIAYHNYGLVDLLLEYISLCALDGRTEFLRRTWLGNILKFQTSYGCFSQYVPKLNEPSWKQANENNNDLLEGQCSGHTTALASSVMAAAIRYILKQYY